MNGTYKNLNVAAKHAPLELPAINLSIVFKNPLTANTTAGSLLLFRPYLVVA